MTDKQRLSTRELCPDFSPMYLLERFCEISAIPRPSCGEGAIADYLCDFAARRGLPYYRDAENNVLITRVGNEAKPPVLLQAHTDMVCEAAAGKHIDMTVEAPHLRVEGDALSADGTTLGADDGAGVAMILALLDEEQDGSMPPLECLFTANEECGMTGAAAFDYSRIRARRVINLDCEKAGCAWVSCAGGAEFRLTLPTDRRRAAGTFLDVSLRGLAGGHSGTDIDRCRENAVCCMAELLGQLYQTCPFCIADFCADGKHNAIPHSCTVRICVYDEQQAKDILIRAFDERKRLFCREDRDAVLRIAKTKTALRPSDTLSFRSSSRLIAALRLLPSGVVSRFADGSGAPDSSCNPATVHINPGSAVICGLARASSALRMDEMLSRITLIGNELGVQTDITGRYPGWEMTKNSPLQIAFLRCHAALLGTEGTIERVHAGLECGILCTALGRDTDCISIGPEINEIHTPRERMSLSGFAGCYRLLSALIKE